MFRRVFWGTPGPSVSRCSSSKTRCLWLFHMHSHIPTDDGNGGKGCCNLKFMKIKRKTMCTGNSGGREHHETSGRVSSREEWNVILRRIIRRGGVGDPLVYVCFCGALGAARHWDRRDNVEKYASTYQRRH